MALTDNLISYWNLDEASGTRADSHGSNDLTDNNTVGSAAGKLGDAASFTAANSEDLTKASPSGLTFDTTNWTITGWVKLTTGAAGFKGIFQQNNFAGPRVYFNGETLSCDFGGNLIGIGDGATSDWVFFAIRWDGTTLEGRLNNGTDVTATGSDTASGSNATIYLGSLAGSNYHDDGIDEFGIWMRDLSDAELLDLYNAGAGLAYPFSGGAVASPWYHNLQMAG